MKALFRSRSKQQQQQQQQQQSQQSQQLQPKGTPPKSPTMNTTSDTQYSGLHDDDDEEELLVRELVFDEKGQGQDEQRQGQEQEQQDEQNDDDSYFGHLAQTNYSFSASLETITTLRKEKDESVKQATEWENQCTILQGRISLLQAEQQSKARKREKEDEEIISTMKMMKQYIEQLEMEASELSQKEAQQESQTSVAAAAEVVETKASNSNSSSISVGMKNTALMARLEEMRQEQKKQQADFNFQQKQMQSMQQENAFLQSEIEECDRENDALTDKCQSLQDAVALMMQEAETTKGEAQHLDHHHHHQHSTTPSTGAGMTARSISESAPSPLLSNSEREQMALEGDVAYARQKELETTVVDLEIKLQASQHEKTQFHNTCIAQQDKIASLQEENYNLQEASEEGSREIVSGLEQLTQRIVEMQEDMDTNHRIRQSQEETILTLQHQLLQQDTYGQEQTAITTTKDFANLETAPRQQDAETRSETIQGDDAVLGKSLVEDEEKEQDEKGRVIIDAVGKESTSSSSNNEEEEVVHPKTGKQDTSDETRQRNDGGGGDDTITYMDTSGYGLEEMQKYLAELASFNQALPPELQKLDFSRKKMETIMEDIRELENENESESDDDDKLEKIDSKGSEDSSASTEVMSDAVKDARLEILESVAKSPGRWKDKLSFRRKSQEKTDEVVEAMEKEETEELQHQQKQKQVREKKDGVWC